MNYEYITAPLLGAFIGYITNLIAIKMLFRPLEAKYFLGIKIPFTPGIIPREKERIAKSIGEAVGQHLLTDQIIIDTLDSQEFQDSIDNFMNQKLFDFKNSQITINDLLTYLMSAVCKEPSKSEELIKNTQKLITDTLYHKINSPETRTKITDYISKSLENYLEYEITNPLVKMAFSLNKGFISSIKHIISEKVEQLISESKTVIEELTQAEIEKLLQLSSDHIYNKFEDKIPEINKFLFESIRQLLKNNMTSITSTLNIANMVTKRIHEFDVLEVEHLILSIVDRELNAIVWLGAFLGFILGLFMPLIG